MITKRKGPPRGRGGGRPKGATGTAGITVTLRLTPEARAILATHERPGRWLSALIESAPARPADDGQDAGPVVDPHDA
jgi:hypothetical protein